MLLTALYHFADRRSKTTDGYFVGFPAIWNLAVLYLFVFPLPQAAALGVIVALAVLTFVPIKWVHPIRVRRLRPVTLAVVAAWAVAAIAAVAQGFPGSLPVQVVMGAAGVYLLALCLSRTLRG